MASFNVRCLGNSTIDKIIFAGDEVDEDGAVLLQKIMEGTFWPGVAIVPFNADEYTSVRIESKEHALNLIKALEKAIELGWFVKD